MCCLIFNGKCRAFENGELRKMWEMWPWASVRYRFTGYVEEVRQSVKTWA